MKLKFSRPSKKQVFGALGVVLLLALAGASGYLSQLLLNPATVPEPPTQSGLPKEIDEVQNLRTSGNEEEAAKKVDELISNPDNSNQTNYMLYIEKGHASFDAGNYQAALASYSKAAEYNENYDILTLVGEMHYRLNKKSEAKQIYLRAIEIIPDDHAAKESIERDLRLRIQVIDEQAKQ